MNCLLIDDDSDFGLIMTHGLKSQRTVSRAETFAEAIPIMERIAMDLIVLDLTLPDSDAVETIARIGSLKDKSPGAKVVVLTANPDERIGRKAYAAGADLVLQKATDYRTTVAAIMDLYRKKQPSECLDVEKVKLIEERVKAIVTKPSFALPSLPASTVAAVVGMLGAIGR